MPFTTVAFLESVDPAAAFNAITALADQHVRISGDDLIVPAELEKIVAVAFGIETAIESFGRLVSPSLRGLILPSFEPFNTASAAPAEPGSPQAVSDFRRNPIPLVRGEPLNAEILSDPAAAQVQWAVIWLADGPIAPVEGEMFTARLTGATTLVANVWTNGALTFVDDLPRGRYLVVGARIRSAGLVAARFVPVGGRWRPGVLGVDAQGDLEHEMFRYGGLGGFFEFEDDEPPTVDYLSISADTAEDLYLDLIQIRSGPS